VQDEVVTVVTLHEAEVVPLFQLSQPVTVAEVAAGVALVVADEPSEPHATQPLPSSALLLLGVTVGLPLMIVTV